MNKKDYILILILLIIILLIFIFIPSRKGNTAKVYYEDKLILTIDMNIDKEYTVDGALGEVILEVKEGKIRVKKETSNRHLCSKVGYTNTSSKPLICLPNKITVKITNDNDNLDGVVY